MILPDRLKILKDALPRAYFVPKMRVLKEDGEHPLNIYYHESFEPRKEVLLNEAVDFKESAHSKGTVEQVTYRPNHVTVKTSRRATGFWC